KTQRTPTTVSGTILTANSVISNSAVTLGPTHPDNPYFGTAARLRYTVADIGPLINDSDSKFVRLLTGVKGTFGSWDYDSAFLYSESRQTDTSLNTVNRDAVNALLNPTAANVAAANASNPYYRALPPGTFYRIGENAN